MTNKLNLSPEERRARSERAKAQYRAGKFGGREIGRMGAAATNAKRHAGRPAEDISGWDSDRLRVALVDVLTDLNAPYTRLKVAASGDPAAKDVRGLLGITYAPVSDELSKMLRTVPNAPETHRNIASLLDGLQRTPTPTTKEIASS